ncbi:conserved hypothetical protein [Trichinella spiralis]|uniref:hypothetical protein n=1 Tax=Trichinella spiralis TaxID=6334 RepID=UPI0001EFBDFC|nr:conserved hypothetical protein [Trichinella spiralis]
MRDVQLTVKQQSVVAAFAILARNFIISAQTDHATSLSQHAAQLDQLHCLTTYFCAADRENFNSSTQEKLAELSFSKFCTQKSYLQPNCSIINLCNVENIPIQTVLLFNVLRSLDHYHPQQQRKQKLPLHKGCKNLFMPTTPFADAKIASTTELNFESTIEALHANSSNNW